MKALRRFVRRWTASVWNRRDDGRLREEMAEHLTSLTEENVRAGLSLDEARRKAKLTLGTPAVIGDVYRDELHLRWVEDLGRDTRYAVRALRRTPGFAVVAIALLSLSTGLATVAFSIIDVALLRPVPYTTPDEIVGIEVGETFDGRLAPSALDVEQWREADGIFSHVGFGRVSGLRTGSIIVGAGTPERLTVGSASEDFLEVFGIWPVLGRAFRTDDRRSDAPLVVLLGHRYWQTRYGGAPDAVGRAIRIDGTIATVIGVLPAGFYDETAVWRPHVVPTGMNAMRGTGVPVYGRLRTGLEIGSAERELTARVSTAAGGNDRRAWLISLYDETTRGYAQTIAVLAGTVSLVVLLACVNVAGLLLGRGAARAPELAIRASIGAGRGRLIRQLLSESMLLAAAGGSVGVVLAYLGLDAVVALVPLNLPDNVTPAVNLQVMAFALVLTASTAVAFGLMPSLRLSRLGLGTHAAGGSAGSFRHGSALTRRGGQALIAVEIAVAVVLLAGASLMVRSLSKILAIDVGFDHGATVTMEVVPLDDNPDAQLAYFLGVLQKVRSIPGVAAAGGIDRPPLDGSGSYTDATVGEVSTTVAQRQVLPGYFEAIGMPSRSGRLPTLSDYLGGPPFAVLSESAARVLFPDQGAVGQSFVLSNTSWTVVGVVGDARTRGPLPEHQRGVPDIYLSYQPPSRLHVSRGLTLVVRPSAPIPGLANHLRRAAETAGAPAIVGPVRTGRDWFGDRVATPRQRTGLLGLMGGVGLMLALVGIFGTTAYAVSRRTREVGIRLALGSTPGQVVRTLLQDAAWSIAVGLAVGLFAAPTLTGAISGFLFETEPTDPPALLATAAVLVSTALLAAWIPARRAARIDPVTALRIE